MHDDYDDYLYATIADLDAAVRYSVRLVREQYAGHAPERCLQCGRRDHPDACARRVIDHGSVRWASEPYAADRDEHYDPDDPVYVSPAVAAASRALAASTQLLSENNDPRLVDGFGIVFGQGYEHSR